jgi:hypothetical protein
MIAPMSGKISSATGAPTSLPASKAPTTSMEKEPAPTALPEKGWAPSVPLPQYGVAGSPTEREIMPPGFADGSIPGKGSPIAPYVRNADSKVDDAAYLKLYMENLTRSMRETFLPALKGGQLTIPVTPDDAAASVSGGFSRQADAYFSMLKGQHDILILGQSREAQADSGQTPAVKTSYRGNWQGKHETVPSLKAGFESAIAPNAPYPDPDGAYRFPLGSALARGEPPTRGPLRLNGLSPDTWPHNDLTNDGQQLVHVGQRYKDMPLMLHSMSTSLGGAFTAIDSLSTASGQPDLREVLNHLSEYLHMASHTHLFERGNVSLFMSHVNYALERAGLNPIEHGGLDVIAMGKHFDEFKPHFLAAVAEANPQANLSLNPLVALSGPGPKGSVHTNLSSGFVTTETAGSKKAITSVRYEDSNRVFGDAQFVRAKLHSEQGVTDIWLTREGGKFNPYADRGGPTAPKPAFSAVAPDGQALVIPPSLSGLWLSVDGNNTVSDSQPLVF